MISRIYCIFYFFFFQAEDGIRDYKVTGVQTCALPILPRDAAAGDTQSNARPPTNDTRQTQCTNNFVNISKALDAISREVFSRKMLGEIGRASCRERV